MEAWIQCFEMLSVTVTYDYTIGDTSLPVKDNVKDLGVILSSNLSWEAHHEAICASPFRQLGLLRRTIGVSSTIETRKVLYLTLVRSKCSQVWRPQLVKEIIMLERVQRRATAFIVQNATLDYRERLLSLKMLPLIMTYELSSVGYNLVTINYQAPINYFIWNHFKAHFESGKACTYLCPCANCKYVPHI